MNQSLPTGVDVVNTALLCDVLDGLGYRETSCGPLVRPLMPGARTVGRAFTLRTEAVDQRPEPPYEQLLGAYQQIRPNDVIVIASGGELRSGLWGELLSIAARARGAVGAVSDGLVRDVVQITELGFPVFAAGNSPLDSDGRQEVVEVGSPVTIGDVTVHPGDLVMGDAMGVVAVPAAVAEEAVGLAAAKGAAESTVRDELAAGADIGEVFARHGIL